MAVTLISPRLLTSLRSADCELLTNVSVWQSLQHAQQMDSLAEMLAQRPILEAAGVTFEPITNHETLWTIEP